MKRYLWVVEVAHYPCGPWYQAYIFGSRREARSAKCDPIYGYRRIVKYVSESTAGSAGTKRG